MDVKKWACIISLAFFVQLSWAQTSNQGAIVGTVTDPSGAVIVKVQVTATNLDTGISSVTNTNSVGDYNFSFLVQGRYSMTAKANGFSTAQITDITLTVGQLLRNNITMRVGSPTEEVTVSAVTTPLNVDTGSRGEVIGSAAIENMPLNGREWIQLATLIPGA